jgi:hypothetical protein
MRHFDESGTGPIVEPPALTTVQVYWENEVQAAENRSAWAREARMKAASVDAKTDHHVTVAEMIAILQRLPQDALVYSEGCDCTGKANGAEFDGENCVEITRLEP